MKEGEEKKKLQRKEKYKFLCPYGCGKTYVTYTHPGAIKHLSECLLQNDQKMVEYMKEKNY